MLVGSGSFSGVETPFRWVRGEGLELLDVLNIFNPSGTANAVSANGSVVVGTSNNFSQNNGAFRWAIGSGTEDLGGLNPDRLESSASDVTRDGSVIVGSSTVPDAFYTHAIRWTAETGMQSLGGLLPGESSFANSVDASGSIVVGDARTAQGTRAMRWTSETGMVQLDVPNSSEDRALRVSDDGSRIFGIYMPPGPDRFSYPCMWDETLTFIPITPLPGTERETTRLFDTNADGSIAVGATRENDRGETFAVIWDEVSGLRRLDELVTDEFGINLGGYVLRTATAITPDTRVIVGAASPSGGGPLVGYRISLDAEPPLNDSLCSADFDGDYDVDFGDFGAFVSQFDQDATTCAP